MRTHHHSRPFRLGCRRGEHWCPVHLEDWQHNQKRLNHICRSPQSKIVVLWILCASAGQCYRDISINNLANLQGKFSHRGQFAEPESWSAFNFISCIIRDFVKRHLLYRQLNFFLQHAVKHCKDAEICKILTLIFLGRGGCMEYAQFWRVTIH